MVIVACATGPAFTPATPIQAAIQYVAKRPNKAHLTLVTILQANSESVPLKPNPTPLTFASRAL